MDGWMDSTKLEINKVIMLTQTDKPRFIQMCCLQFKNTSCCSTSGNSLTLWSILSRDHCCSLLFMGHCGKIEGTTFESLVIRTPHQSGKHSAGQLSIHNDIFSTEEQSLLHWCTRQRCHWNLCGWHYLHFLKCANKATALLWAHHVKYEHSQFKGKTS